MCEVIINFISQSFYLLNCTIQAKCNVTQATWAETSRHKLKAVRATQQVQGQHRNSGTPYLKLKKEKKDWGCRSVVEHLPSVCWALPELNLGNPHPILKRRRDIKRNAAPQPQPQRSVGHYHNHYHAKSNFQKKGQKEEDQWVKRSTPDLTSIPGTHTVEGVGRSQVVLWLPWHFPTHACMHTHSNLRVPKEEEGTERISEELRLYASQIYEIQLSTLPRDYQTPSWKEQHVGNQRANMSTQMTMKSLPGEWSTLRNMQTQGCSHAAGWTQTAKRGNTNGSHFKTKYLLWNYLLLGPWVKQIN